VLLAGAALLAGCGSSGPTDKQLIATIIKREGTHPITLCASLTNSVLATIGGRSACLRQAASSAPDPTTHAASIEVRGTSATAVEVDQAGSHTISFVKRGGVWKVSGVS
jgi:hypothetical protein